jgi:hypothetical protein
MQAPANNVSCDGGTKQIMKRFMKRENRFCAFETNIPKPFSGIDPPNEMPKWRAGDQTGDDDVQSGCIEA